MHPRRIDSLQTSSDPDLGQAIADLTESTPGTSQGLDIGISKPCM